ncbi:adenylosuccinate lyase [Roseovarius sp. 217]|nr:adenylosuccinate lyase [Roseovarius sp. 217]
MMKLKFGLAALALVVTPSLALATGGCDYDKQKQAISCVAGTAWDAATNSCVPQTSS